MSWFSQSQSGCCMYGCLIPLIQMGGFEIMRPMMNKYGCLIPLIQMGGAEIMRPMMNKWEETRTISKPNTENVTATGNRR